MTEGITPPRLPSVRRRLPGPVRPEIPENKGETGREATRKPQKNEKPRNHRANRRPSQHTASFQPAACSLKSHYVRTLLGPSCAVNQADLDLLGHR